MKITMKYLTASVMVMSLAAMPLKAEKLVILHTNDTHSQIDPDTKDNLGGVLRRKAYIDSVRNAEKNVLLIDAGDIVQGTLYFNLFRGEVEEKIMNELGYDLRILGNHEFDNGVDSLAKYISGANAGLLATNYDLSASPLGKYFKPYIIKEFDGKKIGFIGINLNPKGMISDGNYDGVVYLDAVKAANSAAWWLKNIEKVDAVIALTHIGYQSSSSPDDIELIGKSSDIDLVIGGHSHTLLDPAKGDKATRIKNADGEDIVVSQVMKAGKYIGKIDLDLDNLTVDYSVSPMDSRYDDRIDSHLQALLSKYSAGVDSLNHVKVGMAGVDMEKDSPELLNFVSDFILRRAGEMADNIDFALVNKGGIRHGLSKGPIYEGEIISMMPFYNYVTVIDIKGSALRPAFDQMARIGGQGLGGSIKVTYDPKAGKAVDIIIDGKPLDDEKVYRVATIDYLAKGGDYMPTLKESTIVEKSQSVLYDDMLRYLRGPEKKIIQRPSSVRRMTAI